MNLFLTPIRTAQKAIGLCTLCLIAVTPALATDNRVNFEFSQQPMAEVANQISAQLDYKVFMDDQLAKVLVTGIFNDVTLDQFFSRRIFRGQNIVILFDDTLQTVTIRTLGKKSKMTEYNRTSSKRAKSGSTVQKTTAGVTFSKNPSYDGVTDPMDLEVTEGIKRRDIITVANDTDPMDMEVTEGVIRRDVITHVNNTAPGDFEVTEGITRKDVKAYIDNTDPMDMEVTEGIKRRDVIHIENNIDPMDMEVTEGIKRRDIVP